MFAHALNCSGIPPTPRIIKLCPYTHDVETGTQHYIIGTPYHTGNTKYSVHYETSWLCSLSNTFLWLGTPEVILKWEQWYAVVKFVCGRLLMGLRSTFASRCFFFLIVCHGKYIARGSVFTSQITWPCGHCLHPPLMNMCSNYG